MTIESKVIEQASRIRMIILDVDGVMTDGITHVHSDGCESKGFSIRDGFAIIMAKRCGLEFAIITGLKSSIIEYRAERLHIDEVHQGFEDKAEILKGILKRRGINPDQTAYIGDDLFDLPPMRICGLSGAPADAHEDVLARVSWVSKHKGGQGAVREFIEFILKARGDYEEVLRQFTD